MLISTQMSLVIGKQTFLPVKNLAPKVRVVIKRSPKRSFAYCVHNSQMFSPNTKTATSQSIWKNNKWKSVQVIPRNGWYQSNAGNPFRNTWSRRPSPPSRNSYKNAGRRTDSSKCSPQHLWLRPTWILATINSVTWWNNYSSARKASPSETKLVAGQMSGSKPVSVPKDTNQDVDPNDFAQLTEKEAFGWVELPNDTRESQ